MFIKEQTPDVSVETTDSVFVLCKIHGILRSLIPPHIRMDCLLGKAGGIDLYSDEQSLFWFITLIAIGKSSVHKKIT